MALDQPRSRRNVERDRQDRPYLHVERFTSAANPEGNPGADLQSRPEPLRFPLHIRTSRDEGVTWSEPTLLADRPAKVGGWSICYPTLTELVDGTLVAIWAQKKDSADESYSDIHSARITLSNKMHVR